MNDRVLVAKMVAWIESNLIEPITADDMALRSGYSSNRFRQKFFNVTGDTPSGYLRKRRLTEAAKEIMDGGRLADIAQRYGYSSQDNFTTSFRSYFGVTPTELSKIEGKYKRFIRNMREAYTIMEIANLTQPPLDTTLMGCVKGASEFFENDYSTPVLFGLTGHAFVINIHSELCPSSPYVWNKDRFMALLENIGIAATTNYRISKDSSDEQRDEIEMKLKAHLDSGGLCMLDFLEHQLFAGYDEQGFMMLQPWGGKAASEVPAISYGSWNECFEKMGWTHITVLDRNDNRKPIHESAREALEFAVELFEAPEKHQCEGYRIGDGAYEWWIDAVRRGMATGMGNWWNGCVWAECRKNAAGFFRELPEYSDSAKVSEVCGRLAVSYSSISDDLEKAKEKELEASAKTGHLEKARRAERAIETDLRALLEVL